MAERRVLVTGASGVLGWHLCRLLDSDRTLTVWGTCKQNRPAFERIECHTLDLEEFPGRANERWAGFFDIIVHTAAWTNPDECDRDPVRANRVNVEATGRLIDWLRPGGRFIYTSTDLVFDGAVGGYSESDTPNPVNHYGETKLEAEKIVRRLPGGVVVRIAKLYSNGSPFHPCFVTWMKEKLDRGETVPLFRDQFRTPLFIGDAVGGLRLLFDREPKQGLYHLGGPERLNRYEFGRRYAECGGYPLDRLEAIAMRDVGLVARGADCSLDSSRFVGEFSWARTDLEQGLRKLRGDLTN